MPQTARMVCVTAEPHLGGFRYGFRAVDDPAIPAEDRLGGVTLEIIAPLDSDGKPDYQIGDFYTATLAGFRGDGDSLRERAIIDPAAVNSGADQLTAAQAVTAAGSMPPVVVSGPTPAAPASSGAGGTG